MDEVNLSLITVHVDGVAIEARPYMFYMDDEENLIWPRKYITSCPSCGNGVDIEIGIYQPFDDIHVSCQSCHPVPPPLPQPFSTSVETEAEKLLEPDLNRVSDDKRSVAERLSEKKTAKKAAPKPSSGSSKKKASDTESKKKSKKKPKKKQGSTKKQMELMPKDSVVVEKKEAPKQNNIELIPKDAMTVEKKQGSTISVGDISSGVEKSKVSDDLGIDDVGGIDDIDLSAKDEIGVVDDMGLPIEPGNEQKITKDDINSDDIDDDLIDLLNNL